MRQPGYLQKVYSSWLSSLKSILQLQLCEKLLVITAIFMLSRNTATGKCSIILFKIKELLEIFVCHQPVYNYLKNPKQTKNPYPNKQTKRPRISGKSVKENIRQLIQCISSKWIFVPSICCANLNLRKLLAVMKVKYSHQSILLTQTATTLVVIKMIRWTIKEIWMCLSGAIKTISVRILQFLVFLHFAFSRVLVSDVICFIICFCFHWNRKVMQFLFFF